MTGEKPNVAGAKRNKSAAARAEITAQPPPRTPVYGVTCPRCAARPGDWCEAVMNLPAGTLLRDPHDDRVKVADVNINQANDV